MSNSGPTLGWSVNVTSAVPKMFEIPGTGLVVIWQAALGQAKNVAGTGPANSPCTCYVNDCDNAARGTSCATTCSRCPCNNPQCVSPNIKANFCTYPGTGCPDAAQ
jgi:hypothetical protein